MEGFNKRIKSGEGYYDPGDIARLPVDVRVHVLTRVDRLNDLFTLARQMPLMKAFMKEKDVFGKWFRYHTGFAESEKDQVDAYVTQLFRDFEENDGGEVEVTWTARNMSDNNIFMSVGKNNTLTFLTNQSRLRNIFDDGLGLKINTQKYHNNYFDVIMLCDTEPILQGVKVARMIDKYFPDLVRQQHNNGGVSFNHMLPFDLLALCQMPGFVKDLLDEDDLRQDDNEDNVARLGVVLETLYAGGYLDTTTIYTRLVQGLTTREWTVKQVLN